MLKDIAVASGIASLYIAYQLFTYQQLFSPYAMLANMCRWFTTYVT